MWYKGIVLCVSVSIQLNERVGESLQKLISQSSVGVRGHRQEDLSGGYEEASSLGAGTGGGRGEKRPTPPLLRRLKRKPVEVWDLCFSQKWQKQ